MITLYQFKTSPFTEKVRRAMNYKNIAFEVVEVERAKVGEGKYADVSPTGKFPCIKDGDQAVWDSTDIILHIEKMGDNQLVPSDPRAAANSAAQAFRSGGNIAAPRDGIPDDANDAAERDAGEAAAA